MTDIIVALVFMSIGLLIKCIFLQRKLAKVTQESVNHFNFWREAVRREMKAWDMLDAARAERKLWRDKWKAGAFEMDAATMARLADEEAELET